MAGRSLARILALFLVGLARAQEALPERITGVPAELLAPPTMEEGEEAMERYTRSMWAFLNGHEYRALPGWTRDQQWRFTGAVVARAPRSGPISSGLAIFNEGTHPLIRIWYSPGVARWMERGSVGPIADGEMIIKEMVWMSPAVTKIIESLGLAEDRVDRAVSVQEIPQDYEVNSWATMVKRRGGSYDGWYWGSYVPRWEDNPIFRGRSAVTTGIAGRPVFPYPEDDWARWRAGSPGPSGLLFPTGMLVGEVVPPSSLFGAACVNCHASAESESTFSTLTNVRTPGVAFPLEIQFADDPSGNTFRVASTGQVFVKGAPGRPAAGPPVNPYARPRLDPAFRLEFGSIEEATWEDVDEHRFPARTYDQVVARPDGRSRFLTADQCQGCHAAAVQNSSVPPMEFHAEGGEVVDLSPFGEWSTSMMGLAGRDPVFFAQLESERRTFPDRQDAISDTCLHCHGAMGQRQLQIDRPGEWFTRDLVDAYGDHPDATYAALARDGVSCMVCHQMAAGGLGTPASYTGRFELGPVGEVVGPYDDTLPKPMEKAIGVTPKGGAWLRTSAMCGSCHTVQLPVFDREGRVLATIFEQTTYLEWRNSVYQDEVVGSRPDQVRRCQDCHMTSQYHGQRLADRVASIQDERFPYSERSLPAAEIALPVRDGYRRHTLTGINLFVLEMFKQFPIVLGTQQTDPLVNEYVQDSLVTTSGAMTELARNETATLAIEGLRETAEGLEVDVHVENLAGHDFPTGVAFRRAFLELLVEDRSGGLVWASGRTSPMGVLLEGTGPTPLPTERLEVDPRLPAPGDFQPHYQTIEEPYQVQIYEELVRDPEGRITTSFFQLLEPIKDNRIKPRGWSPTGPNAAQTAPHGHAAADPCYVDARSTGGDRITYRSRLDAAARAGVARVRATLYYQSIPPYYLRQRFEGAATGADAPGPDARRLHFLGSHLNLEGSPIEGWKLRVAQAVAEK